MDTKPKGKGLALLALLGHKKSSSSEDGAEPSTPDLGGEADEGGGKSDMAVSDLAESIGVPEEARADFASSFKAAVKACMDDSEGGEY